MVLNPRDLRLYLVTDRALCADRGLVETVSAAVRGGARCVQLRDKDATTAERIAIARALKAALAGPGVPLLINDDVDAARAAGTDGVHLGQDDPSPEAARAQLGPDAIIGLSCDTEAHVRAADPKVVDYLGIGTVFPTATKGDHKPAIGLDGLARLCAHSALPTVAIGGLKAEHSHAVFDAGADGLAVVSAICGHHDPEAAARAFNQPEVDPT
ncbi:MAG: thiamine phosphate synthase [Pseudomonadota bacterium]